MEETMEERATREALILLCEALIAAAEGRKADAQAAISKAEELAGETKQGRQHAEQVRE